MKTILRTLVGSLALGTAVAVMFGIVWLIIKSVELAILWPWFLGALAVFLYIGYKIGKDIID